MTILFSVFSRKKGLVALFTLGILLSWNCNHDEGKFLENIPPVTRLSNIPPPEDTIATKNPRLSLSWVGDDPDGYVVGFRYRWTINSIKDPNSYKQYKIILNIIIQNFALMANTQDQKVIPAVYKYFATLPPEGLDVPTVAALNRGDSIVIEGVKIFASNSDTVREPTTHARIKNQFPTHVNPNSGTFIFDSPDSINLHTFEVEAIDNLGEVSAVPAKVSFSTPQVQAPETQIATPAPVDTPYVLMNITDTFTGIRIAFKGVDPNSRTIDYQWVVDRDLWPPNAIPWSEFSPREEAFIAAKDFPDPYATTHTFYVRSRNEFGAVDPTPATNTFFTIYPEFAKPGYQQKILLINSAFDTASNPMPWHPTRQLLDNYYMGILNELGKTGKVDLWEAGKDPPDGFGFPFHPDFSKYSLVIITADHADFNDRIQPNINSGREGRLKDYCYVGGNLIMTGWAMRGPNNCPDANDQFYRGVIHVNPAVKSFIFGPDFASARGFQGYPNIVWDATKLDTLWFGALPRHWLTQPVGFGEIIFQYDSKSGTPSLQNQPIGVRYIGITFNSVFFPFPLYFVERPIAVEALRKAMSDVGELNR